MVARAFPKRSLGRYDPGRDDFRPADLGHPAKTPNVQCSVVAVTDPLQSDKRLIAHVNRRVDILEMERSRFTISEGAYQAGRDLQHVLEARNRIGPASMDATSSTINGEQKASNMHGRLAHVIDSTVKYLSYVERILGLADAALLKRILGSRMTYKECAIIWGKRGNRDGTRYIAGRFRDALETLSENQAATGLNLSRLSAWHSNGA